VVYQDGHLQEFSYLDLIFDYAGFFYDRAGGEAGQMHAARQEPALNVAGHTG
jgi:hypothetical protein